MTQGLQNPISQETERNTIGWRLRTLRARNGLTLLDVATRAGLDVSYLSRLERDALQNAKPKPDTVNRVLDALGATLTEREAVYHIERPPLSAEEVGATVDQVAEVEDESPFPVTLRDERWFLLYMNRSARAVLGLSDEEYHASIGYHLLHEIIDPFSPRYPRIPDELRSSIFSQHSSVFQVAFASEEFDEWYLQVVARIHDFTWASALWAEPQGNESQLVLDRLTSIVQNPVAGIMRFEVQFSRLMANPRFQLVNWTPLDEATRDKLEMLVDAAGAWRSGGHTFGSLARPFLKAL